jgi:Flp pilus assembly protein TadD
LRLFRQRLRGDWTELFARIAHQLRPLAAPHAAAAPTNQDSQRAISLIHEGRAAEAVPLLDRLVERTPRSAEAHHNRGVALARCGRLEEAVASFRRALELRPEAPDALGNLGLAYLQLGRPAEAADALRQALASQPASADLHNNLGVALTRQNDFAQAIAAYREALRLRPEFVDALNNLGNAYRSSDQAEEATRCYREALRISPNVPDVHNNLGIALTHLGRLEEAIDSFHESLRLKPEFAEASNNLGVTLADLNRLGEAVAAFDGALQVRPEHAETHRNRAIGWLLMGDYERGWEEYEWRWRCENVPRRSFTQPRWRGEDLGGRTVLLWAEQGLGDTIQFARYATLVRAKGGRVVLECQPPLARLLARLEGVDELVVMGQPLPSFDCQIPLMSIPVAFRTSLSSVPDRVPYLTPDPELVQAWREALRRQRGFRVGIAWQGSPKYGGDKARSIPLERFAPLAEVDPVILVSLQKGLGTEQIAQLPARFPLLDLDRQLDGTNGPFMDTAAVIKNLDLVITSDTAVAHLAGALGVPVWVALCCPCDWRWLREREDSPWYPSMRLFRQNKSGDWDDVFRRMAAELRRSLAGARGGGEITARIAPGELLDKLSILQIKSERIDDPQKRRNVLAEKEALEQARDRAVEPSSALDDLYRDLKSVNEALWDVEDAIRVCERQGDFGPRFVELARSVYRHNDRRAACKRKINELLQSDLIEEKSYAPYDVTPEEG